MNSKHEWLYRRAFDIGILLKGLDGLLETLGGTLFLLTSNAQLLRAVHWLIGSELIEDPHGLLATHLLALTQHLTVGAHDFAGAYLLAHGAVKIGLAVGLLRDEGWAYPVALLVLGVFIGYQSWRLLHAPSAMLALLTLVDAVVVALVAREWWVRRLRGAWKSG